MLIQEELVAQSFLWLWLGPGEDWQCEKSGGIILYPNSDRQMIGKPGDWVIRQADGTLTIARSPADKIYHANFEGSTTVLITEDFERAMSVFATGFDYVTADRKLIDTWQNGKCIDSQEFRLEE